MKSIRIFIALSKYAPGKDSEYISTIAFDKLSPGFAASIRQNHGGIIVAGENFGINSSREQAIAILHLMQVRVYCGTVFWSTVFRNAINNGLAILECDTSSISAADDLSVDLASGLVKITGKANVQANLLPKEVIKIISMGGLSSFSKCPSGLEFFSMIKISPSHKRQVLRSLVAQNQTLIAPGIYDAYGARLVENAGFNAAYMTGNGVSASLLGRPDIGQVDLTLITDHARRIASCIQIPLICDADTGYGGVFNIQRTMEEFEAAGVSAIHIEDQTFPKRCAQFAGARSVLDRQEAIQHIKAAVACRVDNDFMIIARTDCAESLGLDEAILRAKIFISEGADAVFIELKPHPDTMDKIARIKGKVNATCLYNLDVGGPISQLKASGMKSLGIDIGIQSWTCAGVFGFSMQQALQSLEQCENLQGVQNQVWSGKEYNAALGLADLEAWKKNIVRRSFKKCLSNTKCTNIVQLNI
jgi:2-methylisocitrate lyase-like PEP mutase family enzyme/3-isopropylmalate dehydratase small subunit